MITSTLKHVSINAYPETYFALYGGFVEGGSINKWMAEVEKYIPDLVDEDEERQEEIRNKFRGDMLEVFAEIFFNIFNADEGVGIIDYEPVALAEDYGVDATGTNVNGHKVAVQVKYRGNPAELITYTDLAKTWASATAFLHLTDMFEHDKILYLFTSGKGANSVCQKVFGKKLVVINRGIISTKVDNNINFWRQAYTMVYNTLN